MYIRRSSISYILQEPNMSLLAQVKGPLKKKRLDWKRIKDLVDINDIVFEYCILRWTT